MKTTIAAAVVAISALGATAFTVAATPPGHPSPAAVSAELPYLGKVLSSIDASQYTYIEVQGADKKVLWLAAPTIAVKKNAMIRYEDGAEMTNFHSKTLNRDFANVRFVNRVMLTTEK